MARPRIPIDTYGKINTKQMGLDEWRARAYFRFSDGSLKQVQKIGVSKSKAVRSLREYLKTIDEGGRGSISPDMRLSDLADRFMEEKRERRSIGTVQTYQVAVDAHIKPDIGKLSIREATTERLNRFIARVADEHGHGAAKNCRSVLSGMMGMAVRNDAINNNPVFFIERIEKPGKPGSKPIAPERLKQFIHAIETDKSMQRRCYVDIFKLMAGTGFRMGEACGLKWSTVNFETNEITMCRIAKYVNGKGAVIQEFGKTNKSNRKITVPASVMAMLKEHRKVTPCNEEDLVFPSIRGGIIDPNNAERALRERRDALGFPGVTSHSLRKCVATILDSKGMSARDIADYLGHEKPSMTQDVYMQRSRSTGKTAEMLDYTLRDIL